MGSVDAGSGHRNLFAVVAGRGLWLIQVSLIVGVASLAYSLYDLARPAHFVGDMYGLEVIVRLIWLLPFVVGLVVTTAVVACRRRRGAGWVAGVATVLLAGGLLVQALGVAKTRRQDAVRSTYPGLSTAELLRVARGQGDAYAVYELAGRQDPNAALALQQILVDESVDPSLRICAAQALANGRATDARALLEDAQTQVRDGQVRQAVVDALQRVDH